MEIKKIENCDYVMFPRMQHRGLVFKHVERERVYALYDATFWWHEYGKEAILMESD